MICFHDAIEDELNNIRNLIGRNRYRAKFVNKHVDEIKIRLKATTVPKKLLFLKLHFKNESNDEIIICNSESDTCTSVQVAISY